MLSTRDPLQAKGHIQTESEGMEKDIPCKWKSKETWRTVWRFLKKLKIELPYDPAIPLLGIYPEKTVIQKTHAPQCSLQRYLR